MLKNIMYPQGTKERPIRRTCRKVDPTSNPSIIIGIPKIITEMADIEAGEEFLVWYEPFGNGKYRIILEST